MIKLTRNNLQNFCRICLRGLQPAVESVYNIHLVPNLTKLLMICTTLNVREGDVYPKSVCQLCFGKLQDFHSFRSLALHSENVLSGIINGSAAVSSVEVAIEQGAIGDGLLEKEQPDEDDYANDDDQLLLPELSTVGFGEKSIKAEPVDVEETNFQIKPNNFHFYKHPGEIKVELDSEYEDHSTSYENNALGTSLHSTEDENDVTAEETKATRNISSVINGTSSAMVHTGKRNRNQKSLKCPLCDKQFYKQVYMDAHIRAVHEGYEKPFLCMQCNKAFTRFKQLHLHIQTAHIQGAQGCEAMFKMLTTNETNSKVEHQQNPSNPFLNSLQQVLQMQQEQINQEVEMDQTCQQCSRTYSSKRALIEHLKRHAKIREHVCIVCGVAKVTRTELNTHMRTHEPNSTKFKCHICPQEFNHKNAIQRHVRIVHEGMRPFPCSFCPKRFGTRNSQMCHERLHTGERPFVCDVCNKRFAQSEGLKSHMKNHDKSLRTHACSFCSQRFITRKNLIHHEDRHRGDKPHICGLCSRGFFKRDDMLLHQRTHTEYMEMSEDSGVDGKSYQKGPFKETIENGSFQSSN